MCPFLNHSFSLGCLKVKSASGMQLRWRAEADPQQESAVLRQCTAVASGWQLSPMFLTESGGVLAFRQITTISSLKDLTLKISLAYK